MTDRPLPYRLTLTVTGADKESMADALKDVILWAARGRPGAAASCGKGTWRWNWEALFAGPPGTPPPSEPPAPPPFVADTVPA